MAVLGVDFGTSNSAVGVMRDGVPHLIELESGQQTLPTAVFFDFDARKMIVGQRASEALLTGEEGRFMRALKSLLGTSLMRESRLLLGERLDFVQIIGRFLAELKTRAEAATGQHFDHALSGRPVLFHSADPARNAQAEIDLRDAYHTAGFEAVTFMNEPEAAALANRSVLSEGDLGLIVDIGGGTSDFTLFRQQGDGAEILASHGVRIGGTDFDHLLSLHHVMPLFGRGSEIRHAFGDQTHQAPNRIFTDLATWQKIPFLYGPDTRRAAQELRKYAVEPDKLGRLCSVLENELGHDVAFAVEAGKIAANAGADADITLSVVERGLNAPLAFSDLGQALAGLSNQIAEAALETVARANLTADQVTQLIFVGGSSLMQVVEQALCQALPAAQTHRGAALTAIVDGLAIGAQALQDDMNA